jgi:hypothetical protein
MGNRTLTDEDISALTEALKAHVPTCNLGLTEEEASTLKRAIKAFDKATSIVGTVVLTAFVLLILGLLSKGFWLSLAAKGAVK